MAPSAPDRESIRMIPARCRSLPTVKAHAGTASDLGGRRNGASFHSAHRRHFERSNAASAAAAKGAIELGARDILTVGVAANRLRGAA